MTFDHLCQAIIIKCRGNSTKSKFSTPSNGDQHEKTVGPPLKVRPYLIGYRRPKVVTRCRLLVCRYPAVWRCCRPSLILQPPPQPGPINVSFAAILNASMTFYHQVCNDISWPNGKHGELDPTQIPQFYTSSQCRGFPHSSPVQLVPFAQKHCYDPITICVRP